MAKPTYVTPALSPTSIRAARLALATAAVSLILLAVLHVLRSDLDPSWHMVSQYAIGDFGEVQTYVFLAMAVACLSLFIAVHTQVGTRTGKIGLGFLVLAVVGLTMAALFNWEHPLHGVASVLGVPGITIAALLIGPSLARNKTWAPARRSLLWIAHLPWISLALMLTALFTTVPSSGDFGPGALVGWPNRLQFLTWSGWIIVVSVRALATRTHTAHRRVAHGHAASAQ